MANTNRTSSILSILGWAAIVFFILIYAAEFIPGRHGPPFTIKWIETQFGTKGLVILNILIVLAFLALLPFRKPTKHVWKSRGAFIAFVIALMTEMFGWPLLIFLLSPILDIPKIAPDYFRMMGGHWPAMVGTIISILGVILIGIGWKQIHKAEGLVTGGLYKYIRHPQYTGIFLFTLGWIVHWPSILTLILWPLLLIAYYWLARYEEKMAIEEFGDPYIEYASKTKRFIPFIF